METNDMEESKEKKFDDARKRLEQAENGGYYVQAFLAEAELRKLLY